MTLARRHEDTSLEYIVYREEASLDIEGYKCFRPFVDTYQKTSLIGHSLRLKLRKAICRAVRSENSSALRRSQRKLSCSSSRYFKRVQWSPRASLLRHLKPEKFSLHNKPSTDVAMFSSICADCRNKPLRWNQIRSLTHSTEIHDQKSHQQRAKELCYLFLLLTDDQ